jgi:predicted lysophospholipase L1 biosynthesis ABC-type transport system permease subunit
VRVLIVEDTRPLARAIADGLRGESMAVDIAFDGGSARDRLAVNDYDVVILDRDLPVVHGDQICRELADGRASLLTVAAVARRVREFGTLKALGWRSRRIIGQVMGESIAIGVLGGATGVALGFGGAALIGKLAPRLYATVGAPSGASVAPAGRNALRSLNNDTAHTVSVTLTASVTVQVILLAVVLAVAGGMIAGSFGGWRAARMRPAAALARVD